MDAEADARELTAALGKAMPKLSGGAPVPIPGATADAGPIVWTTDSRSVARVERRGDAVVLVVGAPPARAAELVAQTWAGLRR
jgi:hypothetical protein